MTYKYARTVIDLQNRNLRSLSKIRLFDYSAKIEYRLTYEGGFAAFLSIEHRWINGRKFYWFGGVGLAHCLTVEQGLKKAIDEIFRRRPGAVITVPGETTYLEAPSGQAAAQVL